MPSRLGEFEQLILFALLSLRDDAYGVTIRQEIEARTGRQVSAGAVYTALSRLEGRGMATSRVGDTTPERGGRRRKYYAITPEGAELLQRSYEAVQQMARGLVPRLSEVAGSGDGTPD